MKRVIKAAANIPFGAHSDELSKAAHAVTKDFDDGSTEIEGYSFAKRFVIKEGDNLISKSLIQKVILPTEDVLKQVSRIEFANCIFVNEVDLNFHQFDGKVIFKNCIFTNDFTLFGSFYNYVSFEQSSFINSKVNFQDCLFAKFNFRIVTLNDSSVYFQETEFDDESPVFSDTHLYNSSLRFMGTVFPTSARVLNFQTTKADHHSFIQFRMVDFDFREFRLFNAKISAFEFTECTFNCNRFEWECECETLSFQNCRNFRIVNLANLKGLKHLNIHALENTGRIIFGDNIDYYLSALRSSKKIFWVRSNEYRQIALSEFKDQLVKLVDFLAASQQRQSEIVLQKIEAIEREKDMMSGQGLRMKIFLSYSRADESLADSIEEKFTTVGIPLIRDKKDNEYRGSIKEFMKKIRFNDYVVLVISPSYLQSANCMFEIAELTKDDNYKTRILPVIKKDTGIFDPIGRNSYALYWQEKFKKLYNDSDKLDPLSRTGAISELLRYERIMRDLPGFLQSIADMNMIVCKDFIDADMFSKMMSIVNSTTTSALGK